VVYGFYLCQGKKLFKKSLGNTGLQHIRILKFVAFDLFYALKVQCIIFKRVYHIHYYVFSDV